MVKEMLMHGRLFIFRLYVAIKNELFKLFFLLHAAFVWHRNIEMYDQRSLINYLIC